MKFLSKKWVGPLFAAAAVVSGLLYWGLRPPSWSWVSFVLAGDWTPDDSGNIRWEGVWPSQAFVLPVEISGDAGAIFLGRRSATIHLPDGPVTGRFHVQRTWALSSDDKPPRDSFVHAGASLSGTTPAPFPLLKQVNLEGSWQIDSSGWKEKNESISWDISFSLAAPVFDFGPEGREKSAGTLALDDLRGKIEVRGTELRLTRLEGTSKGIRISGSGTAQLTEPPESTTLDLEFHLKRSPGAAGLQVAGWDSAWEGDEEILLSVKGWLKAPVFYVNGFALIPEMEGRASGAGTGLAAHVEKVAAMATGFSPDDELPRTEDGLIIQQLSDSDKEKLQAILDEHLKEAANREQGPTLKNTEWGKRRRELKRAYKDEMRKMVRENPGLRRELGPKPMKRFMADIDKQLTEEFGGRPTPEEAEEANARAAQEQAAPTPNPSSTNKR